DVLEDVEVDVDEDLVVQVAVHDGRPVGELAAGQQLRVGVRGDALQVEQGALHVREALHQLDEQPALAAGDVGDRADAGEVEAVDDRRGGQRGDRRHRLHEVDGGLGPLGAEVGVEVLAVDVRDDGLPGPDRVGQPGPGLPGPGGAHPQHQVLDRDGRVLAQVAGHVVVGV